MTTAFMFNGQSVGLSHDRCAVTMNTTIYQLMMLETLHEILEDKGFDPDGAIPNAVLRDAAHEVTAAFLAEHGLPLPSVDSKR